MERTRRRSCERILCGIITRRGCRVLRSSAADFNIMHLDLAQSKVDLIVRTKGIGVIGTQSLSAASQWSVAGYRRGLRARRPDPFKGRLGTRHGPRRCKLARRPQR